MSSESSIVVKMTDRYSDAAKSMAKTTRALTKDIDGLEKSLYDLTQNKAELKIDLKQARDQLREAEARFKSTGSEVDRLSAMFAHVQVENLTRNLKAVNGALTETDKRISKVQNRAGGMSGLVDSLKENALALQLGQMYSQALGQGANSLITSAFGSTTEGAILSSTLSGAASGAAIGFSLGGLPGAIAGAFIASGAGLISGLTQDFENKDDFFKDYYNNLYEERISAGETALTAGSTTAGSREQSYKAFEKRLGEAQATAYLAEVKHMAAQTNYGYDEILGYSKLLLNSYAPEEIFGLLTTLSDATAGLGLNSSDVDMFIKGLSRMRTTGKVTQEYLNYFSERGVDVYEALAQGAGVDKSKIADMVTRGKIKGGDAAEYIVEFLNESYGGLSKELMNTYDAMVANLKDVQTNVEEGYGTGYNEERKPVVQAMTDALDGKLGGALTEVNELAGFAQGYAENVKENTWLDIMEAVFNGDTELREGVAFNKDAQAKLDQYRGEYLAAYFRYYDAKEAGDRQGMYEAALEVDRIRQQAETLAGEVYGVSDTNKALVDSQTDLITETRVLADTFKTWSDLYGQQQEKTKGQGATTGAAWTVPVVGEDLDGDGTITPQEQVDYLNASMGGRYISHIPGAAVGLDRVPYDNYPALLHQGERVLTAQQAREADRASGVRVVISGNEFHIREDADVDRVAQALLDKLQMAAVRG